MAAEKSLAILMPSTFVGFAKLKQLQYEAAVGFGTARQSKKAGNLRWLPEGWELGSVMKIKQGTCRKSTKDSYEFRLEAVIAVFWFVNGISAPSLWRPCWHIFD